MPSVEEHIENIYLIVNDSYNEQFNNEEYTSLIPYFYTFYKVFNNPKDIEKCNFLLDKYFQKLSALGFVNGIGENNFFSQYSVLAEISLQSSIKESYKSDIKKIKQYLFHQTFDLLQRQDINHLSQIVSSLHYFSLNLPDITSEKYLKELLPLLYKLIKEKIYSSNSFYHEKNEELLHLGFAHGLSGVLLVLIGIYANGIKEKNIVDIVETGIKYILSFKREIDFYVENFAMFPEKVKLNHEVEFSNQLTWAASDLNQAILLYKAHDLLKYKDLPKIADLIGLNTLIRQEEKSTQIVSSNFYDGAAGVAQSYRNLYVLSKHQAYWEGYKFWIEKTVFFLDKEIQDKKNLNPKLNLLNGIPGVGLTLLSFVSKEELFWNKYFFA